MGIVEPRDNSPQVYDLPSPAIRALSQNAPESLASSIAWRRMKLVDRVAQSRAPFSVQNCGTARVDVLNNTADCAEEVARCPLRFVLSDDLTRLCTALAYSKGSRSLDALTCCACPRPLCGSSGALYCRRVRCELVPSHGQSIQSLLCGRQLFGVRTDQVCSTCRSAMAASIPKLLGRRYGRARSLNSRRGASQPPVA